jgi:hypothetical protein
MCEMSVRTCARMYYQLRLTVFPHSAFLLLVCSASLRVASTSLARRGGELVDGHVDMQRANNTLATTGASKPCDKHRIHHLKAHDMGTLAPLEPPISKRYGGHKILVALLADCPIFCEPSRRPYQSLDVLALVMQSDTLSERKG